MGFGEFKPPGTGAPMSEINTTPLVDVMLVLLIIFMVTAPLMTQSIDIELPRATQVQSTREQAAIMLEIERDGQLIWDGSRIEAAQLKARLELAARLRPMPQLHLRADRQTRYEQIAQVLAAARAAGLHSVGFVTLPESGD